MDILLFAVFVSKDNRSLEFKSLPLQDNARNASSRNSGKYFSLSVNIPVQAGAEILQKLPNIFQVSH